MKKIRLTIALAAVALIAGSPSSFADAADSHADALPYKDLYQLKELHSAFHRAVSHAGVDATSRAEHIADILALWTDDGMLVAGGVTYSGKGTPGTASCAAGSLTLCDLYSNIAGAFVLGHDWVSLTPIFTEAIKVLDATDADIFFQCVYFDVRNNDALVSNVTFGLPGMPSTGRAKKVGGHWLLSYGEVMPIAPPKLDVK